jgi:hypothetical protein
LQCLTDYAFGAKVSLLEATAIQLIVATIAFLAGFFLQRIRGAWAYLSARRFWRPILRRDLALVLGDGFPDLRGFEASNVIGRGDLIASYELTTHFSRMGFRRLRPVFADQMVGDDLTGRSLRRNLIVLGGPDANSVSLKCLRGMQLSYQLTWPDRDDTRESASEAPWRLPRLAFTGSDKEGNALVFRPTLEGKEVIQDYGVIIRARNPFDPWGRKPFDPRQGKRVVIIYGCYGFGTLAAVLYSQTKEFLEMIENGDDDIECIVVCTVVKGTPQAFGHVYFKKQRHGSFSRRVEGTLNALEAHTDPGT